MINHRWYLYTPENLIENVLYLKSDMEGDWYEYQKKLSPDRLKITFDDNGVVKSFSCDASSLFPINEHVAELDIVPDDLTLDGMWLYDGRSAYKREMNREELKVRAENEKYSRLRWASEIISPLQDAEELSIANESELKKLKEWKAYRVRVSRVDTDSILIEWPSEPTK